MFNVPTDYSQLLAIVSNPVTAGVVLSILIESLPFIQNKSVSNWVKLGFITLVCLSWSTLVSLLTLTPGTVITASWVYNVIALGVGVEFSTQAFHAVVNNLPSFSAFLLALLGKPSTTASITLSTSASDSSAAIGVTSPSVKFLTSSDNGTTPATPTNG